MTDMISLDEYMHVAEAWYYKPGEDSCPFEPGFRLGLVRRPPNRARLLDPGLG